MLKSVRFGFMLLDFIGQCLFEITQCERSSFHADLLFFYFFAVICLFLKKGRDVMY